MRNLPIKSENFQYLENSFKQWLDTLGYAQTTVYSLPNHIRELFYYLETGGTTHIKNISNQQIKAHYNNLKTRGNKTRGGGLSASYLNKHLQALLKFTDYLRQTGKIILPILNIKTEKEDSYKIKYLNQEEIKQLFKATENYNKNTKLEYLNARDGAMLSIFYSCGLRRTEAYYLDLSDINLDTKILKVRKGKQGKARLVPFNKNTAKNLEDWIYNWRIRVLKTKKENALFISPRGKRVSSQSLLLRVKILQLRTENIELQNKYIGLHTLRHSIATHLLQNGMSLEDISRFLGHSSLESTQIYTHLKEEEN